MKTLFAMCLMVCFMAAGCMAEVPEPLIPRIPHKPHLGEKIAKIEVLDFYTTWCLPCRLAAPSIDLLIAQGHKITKIDAEKEPKLAHKHKINSYPTYVVLKRGKEVYRTHNVGELRRYLNDHRWRRNRQNDKSSPGVNPNLERDINHNLRETPKLPRL